MNNEAILQILRNLSLKKIAIVFIMALLVVFATTIILKGDEFSITPLSIPASNESVEVVDDGVYVYNGASFYKHQIKTNAEPKILGGGVKLPVVTEAFWAKDKGVLLNFDQSTISTEVSEAATKLNLSYTEERSSTWYFNFSDNSLSHVGSFQVQPNTHYYDEKTGLLNYIVEQDGLPILHSYDITARQDTVTLLASGFASVSAISRCFDKPQVICVTGRLSKSPQNSGIYATTTDNGVQKKYEVGDGGEIYSTPNSPWIITLDKKDDDSDQTDGSISQYKKATALNLQTKEQVTINKSLGPGNFLYTVYGQNNVAMIGVGGSKYLTTGTLSGIKHTSENNLKYADGRDFDTSPIVEFSPQKDLIMFTTTDGDYDIFAQQGVVKNQFSKVNQKQALKNLTACANGSDVEWQPDTLSFTVFLPDTPDFKSNTKRVSDCIIKNKLTHGYQYSFTSVDPITGRPTSY